MGISRRGNRYRHHHDHRRRGHHHTLGGSDAAAGGADAAEAAAILGPEAAAAGTAIGADTATAIADDLVAAVEDATAQAPEVQPIEAETAQVENAVEKELAQNEEDPPQDPPPTSRQRVSDILRPGGKLLGQPGNTANCRLVSDQQELDQVWNEFRSEFGPGRQVGPGGQIERIDLGNGDYLQYRPYSRTGGATIDIRVQGEPMHIIHINSSP